MMNSYAPFPTSYAESRSRFMEAARAAEAQTATFDHASCGADGEPLSVSTAWFGTSRPRAILVLVSGVHGVELMCGSGCQVDLMASGVMGELPADLGVLMIHAINPWGAENLRRTNEDNVDLCRNCPDFSQALPMNDGYASLHEIVSADQLGDIHLGLKQLVEQQGMQSVVGALMAGQHNHPDGFGFGGAQRAWSTKLLMQLICTHAASADAVAVVEYHSGLGDYGQAMAVCMQSGADLQRAREWYLDSVVAPREGQGAGHQASGHTTDGYERALPDKALTAIVLEFGTYDMQRNFTALIDDHWLSCVAPPDHELTLQVKREMLAVHLPEEPEWWEMVLDQSRLFVQQALAGLCESARRH